MELPTAPMTIQGAKIDSAANRILIPEILEKIIPYLDGSSHQQHYKRLMSVSRLFFECTAPFLWKEIHLDQLFVLVPELNITIERVDFWKGTNIMHITFPEAADFTRFEVYARFTQHLSLIAPGYRIYNEHVLEAYCLRKNNTMLPNLKSLWYIYGANLGWSPPSWLSWLVAPTLTRVTTHPQRAQHYSPEEAGIHGLLEPVLGLQDLLARQCPNLQMFKILFFDSVVGGYLPENTPILHRALPSLNRLRVISGDRALVKPQTLQVLSMIPSLEEINVSSNYIDTIPIDVTNIPWPANPFPSIRNLRLEQLRPSDVPALLSISSLATPLKLLNITFRSEALRGHIDFDEWAELLIRSVPTLTPRLTSLTLAFGPNSFDSFSQVELKGLAQLPLKHVELQSIYFSDAITSLDIAAAFPRVRTLRLSSVPCDITDLQNYASHLLHLQVLGCSEVLLGPDIYAQTFSISPIRHEIVLEIHDIASIKNGDLGLYARCISELWRYVSCARDDYTSYYEASDNRWFLCSLNDAIFAHRRQLEEARSQGRRY